MASRPTLRGGAHGTTTAGPSPLVTDVVHVLDAAARGTATYVRSGPLPAVPKLAAPPAAPAATRPSAAATAALQAQPGAPGLAEERERLLEAHRKRMAELDRG